MTTADNEDIFNRASYNMNSEEDKANFSKYPAYEIFKKNEYSMQKMQQAYPREYQILENIYTEAIIKSNMCEALLWEYKHFLMDILLKDMDISILIASDTPKYEAYAKFEKNVNNIIEKHMKLGDEFEATLN